MHNSIAYFVVRHHPHRERYGAVRRPPRLLVHGMWLEQPRQHPQIQLG